MIRKMGRDSHILHPLSLQIMLVSMVLLVLLSIIGNKRKYLYRRNGLDMNLCSTSDQINLMPATLLFHIFSLLVLSVKIVLGIPSSIIGHVLMFAQRKPSLQLINCV